ncbi:MAG: archaeal heat shock protein Hsp20 [Nitrososphaeraceae archaeon]|nr:archaeal heat shock protein Hsp20 [Nitrososphaeraceae archaeon]
MSFPNDIDPYNFFRQLFGSSRRGFGRWNFEDIFRQLDEMRRNMEGTFSEEFANIQDTVPKDLIKEYETSEGGKVREVGPIVYGYSMTIGPDGKPKIREFGNVKPSDVRGTSFGRPSISSEREPLVDISSEDKEVKIIAEMPGISKEKIRINVYDDSVEITSDDPKRRYHKTVELSEDVDIDSAKSRYNNGILEIVFKKKEQQRSKGRQINIE